MSILKVQGLKKVYSSRLGSNQVEALRNVNFSVEQGEFVAVMGESGSGKSVTAYSVMGLTAYPGKLIGGTINFNGHQIDKMSEKEMRKIRGNEVSIIFQDPMTSLNPVYTIGNQITEVICLHTGKSKKEAHDRAKELLELVEMEVRELLDFYGFPGDETPIIRGSALNALVSESTDPNAPEYACIKELMDAVDSWIPTPDRKEDMPFLMPVEDVFTISGRGTVATGRVERGKLNLNEKVEIVGLSDEKKKTVVTGIEMFHKLLDYAEAGDNIGALLRGVAKTEIERGQVLSKPGSIHPHTKFVGQVYVLTKDEGGRHTPFFNNYRPQFYFRTTDVTGVITLPEGTEMCMPGDNVDMKVELITPIAIENGLRFAIREGGRTVGSGVVGKIIE